MKYRGTLEIAFDAASHEEAAAVMKSATLVLQSLDANLNEAPLAEGLTHFPDGNTLQWLELDPLTGVPRQ